jgi:O-acetylserine/cysteine efflux transporter
MRLSHLALAILVCFAWGLNAVAAKIGVTYIPPVFFTALRYIAVFVCMVPWLKPVPGKWDVLIPAVFFMGGLHFALIFSGVKFSDASTMSIVNQIYVPISVLLAMVFLGEVVSLRRWLGIAVAFSGVVVFSLNANATSHLTGILLLVADAVSMAIGTVLLRRLAGVNPFIVQAWMAALGVPFLLLTSFIFETGQVEAMSSAPPVAWWMLAYAVVGGSFIGHTGYYVLLQHYEVSLVGAMLLIGPVIGVLGGVLILGEPFTPLIVVGSAMTLLGVGIVLKRSEIPSMEPAEGV